MNNKLFFCRSLALVIIAFIIPACAAPKNALPPVSSPGAEILQSTSTPVNSTGTAAPTRTHNTPTLPPQVQASAARAKSVIIDADMGIDDVMAILYLLNKPEFQVKAITVSGTGLAHCEPGMRTARGLVALAGAGDIPVACGRQQPLRGEIVFPEDWRAGADGLADALELPVGGEPSEMSATELLVSTVESSVDKPLLLTLGPLTNIAEMMQARPELAKKVAMIYSMGGAVNVAGNVADQPSAEWNIYTDPYAASLVFDSGAPLTLVPLDATNQAPITADVYRTLEKNRLTPAAEAIYRLLAANPYIYESGTYFYWDPIAAAILADNSLAVFASPKLYIQTEGEDIGRTVEGSSGRTLRMALSANAARFEGALVSALNGGAPVKITRSPTDTPPAPLGAIRMEGDECIYDGPGTLPPGKISLEFITKGKTHNAFALVVATLREGKTFADLDAWPSTDQPPWLDVVAFAESGPDTQKLFVANLTSGPIYIVCFYAPPETKFATLGPIEVSK